MLKDEVIKFLNDNGGKLIIGGYINYLDLKRKKMLKFDTDNDTFVNMIMQQYFISTMVSMMFSMYRWNLDMNN